jgi:hypothetical protein
MTRTVGSTPPFRLLCVGDAGEIAKELSGQECDVRQAADCGEALQLIAEQGADVVLLSASTLTGAAALPLQCDLQAVRTIAELLTLLSRTPSATGGT